MGCRCGSTTRHRGETGQSKYRLYQYIEEPMQVPLFNLPLDRSLFIMP